MVPSGMGEELQRQREMCIDPYTRVANRSFELVEMDVKTVLTLEKSAKGLRVATTICNQAKDHRVRVIFPDGTACIDAYGGFCVRGGSEK